MSFGVQMLKGGLLILDTPDQTGVLVGVITVVGPKAETVVNFTVPDGCTKWATSYRVNGGDFFDYLPTVSDNGPGSFKYSIEAGAGVTTYIFYGYR